MKILLSLSILCMFLSAACIKWSVLALSMPESLIKFDGVFQGQQTQNTISSWNGVGRTVNDINSETKKKSEHLNAIKRLQKQADLWEKEMAFEMDRQKRLTGVLVDVKGAE